MIKRKKRISYFPNVYSSINNKSYRSMNIKLGNIYKDFNLLINIDEGKNKDKLRIPIKNKKSLSNLFKLNINKRQENKKENKKEIIRNKSELNFWNFINNKNINKSSISNDLSFKEINGSFQKTNIIKNLKLNFSKKKFDNNFAKTSRYLKHDFFQKELENKKIEKQIKNIDSYQNNENPNANTKINNRKNIFNMKKLKKIKILDNSNTIKKIFIKKSRKLMKEIESLQIESEKEKEKEFSKKENYLNDKRFLPLKNNSMILKSKLPITKIDEELEDDCRENASFYQKKMGFFYSENSKKGLYTSHFFTVLKKDKFFTHDIIQKISQYS